jgi:hypothetical protein
VYSCGKLGAGSIPAVSTKQIRSPNGGLFCLPDPAGSNAAMLLFDYFGRTAKMIAAGDPTGLSTGMCFVIPAVKQLHIAKILLLNKGMISLKYLKIVLMTVLLTLISCNRSQSVKTVNYITKNMSAQNGRVVVVKGLLHISEAHHKLLFASEKGGAYLDLVLDVDQLPLDSYNINTHYCVIVKGHFMQYLDGMVLMGNKSLHGRIEVYNIEHC